MLNVLIVEDAEADQVLLGEAIASADLPVRPVFVSDGILALAYLRGEHPYENADPPAVLLLDGSTPRLDAVDVVREIRSDPATRTLPVIVFSGSADPNRARRCYEAGANGYVIKPLELPDYFDVVQTTLRYWTQLTLLPRPTSQS